MSAIYYALIVFPILFIVTLIFIFQGSVTEIEAEQFKINCPYPIYDGIASNLTISGVTLQYDITYGNGTSNEGTLFICTNTGDLLGASTTIKEYGATLFGFIPYGWLGYLADTLTQFLQKAQSSITMVYFILDAPAVVTGLSFFTYVNIVLFALIALGIFMIARGI